MQVNRPHFITVCLVYPVDKAVMINSNEVETVEENGMSAVIYLRSGRKIEVTQSQSTVALMCLGVDLPIE